MLFIGNGFFELELEAKAGSSLKEAFTKNPLLEQLQYLPLLFLSQEDTLIVTKYPDTAYLNRLKKSMDLPRILLLEEVCPKQILRSWGSSDLIAKWAREKGIEYDMPPLSFSKAINSKRWNFHQHLPIQGAKEVFSLEELKEALKNATGQWVLKTDQGFSGIGHFIFYPEKVQKAAEFAKKEWNAGRGIILEPWVKRLLDFSSQWFIQPRGDIELLGLTKCINTPSGSYLGTETGHMKIFDPFLIQVEEHVEYCKTYLKKIQALGFFGHLGVDAMIYELGGLPKLQPVLEVNARMTMSAAVLLYHQRHSQASITRIDYLKSSDDLSLLPDGYKRKLILKCF